MPMAEKKGTVRKCPLSRRSPAWKWSDMIRTDAEPSNPHVMKTKWKSEPHRIVKACGYGGLPNRLVRTRI